MAPSCGADPGAAPAPPPRGAAPAALSHAVAPAPEAATAPSTLLVTVPAVATTAWTVRQQFAAWLTALRWPALAVEDIVYAVSEAVSNSIEHAYPPGTPDPVIEISAAIETSAVSQTSAVSEDAPVDGAWLAGGAGVEHDQSPDSEDEQQPGQQLRIRVRDHGSWRPVPPDPSHRGRGLQVMMALMNDVVIHHSDTGRPGTEIILVSPTVVPEPPASA